MTNEVEFKYKKINESNGFLLLQLTQLWQRQIRKELADFDLTHTQFALLASLAWFKNNNKVVTQVDIANHIQADKMMVSNVLRTLEKKDLLSAYLTLTIVVQSKYH